MTKRSTASEGSTTSRGLHLFRALLLCLVVTTPDALQAQTDIPQDPRVVASSRGEVYYPLPCPAWQRLSPDHRIVFPDSAAALRAGYRRTTNRRCAEPAGITLPAPERDLPPAGAGRRIAGACVVARVLDGDTVDCEGGARIRLLLIDAPEISQSSFGLRARLALEEMLPPGDTAAVELDVQERDRYGRLLAHLHAGGTWVNRAMVRRGWAVPLVYPPNVRWVEEMRAARDSARVEGRGLWEVGAFECLPREWRAGRCGS